MKCEGKSHGSSIQERVSHIYTHRLGYTAQSSIVMHYNKKLKKKYIRNDMFTIFLQQTISGRLLIVVIVGAKK